MWHQANSITYISADGIIYYCTWNETILQLRIELTSIIVVENQFVGIERDYWSNYSCRPICLVNDASESQIIFEIFIVPEIIVHESGPLLWQIPSMDSQWLKKLLKKILNTWLSLTLSIYLNLCGESRRCVSAKYKHISKFHLVTYNLEYSNVKFGIDITAWS